MTPQTAVAVLHRGLPWRCCCSGSAVPWQCCAVACRGGASAAAVLLQWQCCAVAVLLQWQCCAVACRGGASAAAVLQLWRLLYGTSRSERLSVSEFRSVFYACRGCLLHASFYIRILFSAFLYLSVFCFEPRRNAGGTLIDSIGYGNAKWNELGVVTSQQNHLRPSCADIYHVPSWVSMSFCLLFLILPGSTLSFFNLFSFCFIDYFVPFSFLLPS